MGNFLIHIEAEGPDELEHVAKLVGGLVEELGSDMTIQKAIVSSHVNFSSPMTVDVLAAKPEEAAPEAEAPTEDELLAAP